MNEVLKTIKSRRSVRSFRQEPIKQEELDMIIEAAIYAPSGHNTQPWHFTVIENREVISHINSVSKEFMAKMDIDWIRNAGMNPDFDITYNAPVLVIISGRKDAISWRTDCAAAIENMLIAAESLNIGSVWLGFAVFCFMAQGEAEKIGIPEGYEPCYGVALGYKKQDKEVRAPKRNYDVVNYIR
jgi:nitroreductase